MTGLAALKARVRAIAAQHMAQDSAHDLAHLDRVWTNAQRIGQSEGGCDPAVSLVACYLHDLVNLRKDSPDRAQASRAAAAKAAPHCAALGLGADQCAAVEHAIAAHSFSAGIAPETPEARALRDADRLDAIGAIGIARSFAVSGALARPLYDPQDPFARARTPDDARFALDHWPRKLLRLADGMTTETGRQMAAQRLSVMHGFLAALAGEIGADAPTQWMNADV